MYVEVIYYHLRAIHLSEEENKKDVLLPKPYGIDNFLINIYLNNAEIFLQPTEAWHLHTLLKEQKKNLW